jgi:hypothetical protein
MADETENQVPNTPNQTESRHEAEVREQLAADIAWRVGGPAWRGWMISLGGGGGDAPAEPRGEEQMELITQGAGGMGPAHGQAPPEVAQGVQMAQNTQELSLTTPVLFHGKCKDGKSIPPNAFLMELEARQTRHGWEPSMLLRFVKSCLRGEAGQW